MLPLKRRIKKDSFDKIMKEGLFLHGTNLYLRVLDRKDSLPSLFAFVIPAKVQKTSVGRHLIKRRLSAVVENLLISIKTGLSVILLAKKDVSTLPYLELEKEITELLKKAKIFI
jgi:ribonuclease P protein component